jgi:hypothetical protein
MLTLQKWQFICSVELTWVMTANKEAETLKNTFVNSIKLICYNDCFTDHILSLSHPSNDKKSHPTTLNTTANFFVLWKRSEICCVQRMDGSRFLKELLYGNHGSDASQEYTKQNGDNAVTQNPSSCWMPFYSFPHIAV